MFLQKASWKFQKNKKKYGPNSLNRNYVVIFFFEIEREGISKQFHHSFKKDGL